jgi:hypothetical protein
MTRNALLGAAAGLVVVMAATHLLLSVVAGTVLHASYPHRMFDIRRWPVDLTPALTTEMVAMFLGGRVNNGSGTVFYGSSFTYGYPWQESVVMSQQYRILRPQEDVLNVSVLGATMTRLDNGILCGARNAGTRTRTAIVELPVINTVSTMAAEYANNAAPPAPCDAALGPRRYSGFAMRHPLGIGWAPFIWDDKAFPKSDENLVLAEVPPGYFTKADVFAKLEAEFRARITSVVRAAVGVADRVFVYPSPVFLTGAAEIGEDAGAIRAQLDAAVDACRSVAGVVCLDPQNFYTQREAFYNMTHLNQRGHQAMAEWFASQIAP